GQPDSGRGGGARVVEAVDTLRLVLGAEQGTLGEDVGGAEHAPAPGVVVALEVGGSECLPHGDAVTQVGDSRPFGDLVDDRVGGLFDKAVPRAVDTAATDAHVGGHG